MAYDYDRRSAAAPTFDVRRLERLVAAIKHEADQMVSAVTKYKSDPGRMLPQLDNAVKSGIEIESSLRVFYRTLGPEFTGTI